MNDASERTLLAQSLRFFGAISASLSHEINNVLAILSEVGGLLGDLLRAAEEGRPFDAARAKGAVDKIEKQVYRGAGYVEQLNRLAHSVDRARLDFDAREMLELTVTMCRRLARLRKVDLSVNAPDDPCRLSANPFDFMHVVFRCIEIALLMSKNGGGEILTDLVDLAPGASIATTGPAVEGVSDEFSSKLNILASLVERLGGKLVPDVSQGRPLRLVVELPGSPRVLSSIEE